MQVYDTLHFIKPDVVMVELCAERAQRLRNQDTEEPTGLWPHLNSMFGFLQSNMQGEKGAFDFKASMTAGMMRGFYKYGSICFIVSFAIC